MERTGSQSQPGWPERRGFGADTQSRAHVPLPSPPPAQALGIAEAPPAHRTGKVVPKLSAFLRTDPCLSHHSLAWHLKLSLLMGLPISTLGLVQEDLPF